MLKLCASPLSRGGKSFRLSPESFRFPVDILWDAHGTSYCGVPLLDQFQALKGQFLLGQKLLASLQFH